MDAQTCSRNGTRSHVRTLYVMPLACFSFSPQNFNDGQARAQFFVLLASLFVLTLLTIASSLGLYASSVLLAFCSLHARSTVFSRSQALQTLTPRPPCWLPSDWSVRGNSRMCCFLSSASHWVSGPLFSPHLPFSSESSNGLAAPRGRKRVRHNFNTATTMN